MLRSTAEKGIIMGESPYVILSTSESPEGSGIEVLQAQIENFILDERNQGGIPIISPNDQDAPKLSQKTKK